MSAYTVTYQVSNVLVVHHVQSTQRVLLILSTPFGAMYSSSTGTVSASRKTRAEFVVALSPHTACLIAKTEFVCVPTVHLGGARSMQPRTLGIVACLPLRSHSLQSPLLRSTASLRQAKRSRLLHVIRTDRLISFALHPTFFSFPMLRLTRPSDPCFRET